MVIYDGRFASQGVRFYSLRCGPRSCKLMNASNMEIKHYIACIHELEVSARRVKMCLETTCRAARKPRKEGKPKMQMETCSFMTWQAVWAHLYKTCSATQTM